MIKIIFCLRRLPTLSLEGFHRYWLEQHAPLVREFAPAPRMRRYTQSHSFGDPRLASSGTARGITAPAFDGVAELWWDSLEDLRSVGATAESRAAGRRLIEDERNFIDLPNSPLFFAHEHEIVRG